MFNLNIPPTSLLGVDSGGLCSTPKTPEIVNSLIAMTNPLDNYTFTPNNNNNNCNNNNNNNCENSNSNNNNQNGGILILHQQKQNFKNNNNNNNSANQQLLSQDSSHSSCSGSPLDSPCGTNTTPSVQQTRSQLIKAGLKLSIQSKRKMSSGDSSSGNEQSSSRKYARKSIGDSSITNDGDSSDEEDDSYADIKPSQLGLTPEDEDRRRRRRERNKIAATKCRMKKRERTINLVSESETLETQNVDLKTQVKSLEIERRKLFEMLQNHACVHPGGYQPPTKLLQSPAYKYLKNLGLGNGNGGDDGDDEDDDEIICNEQQQQHHQQQQQQQQPRTVIPPVATIKYSRNNGLRQQQHQQHQQQQQQQHNLQDILPNGYCKPSPTTHELGYLSSPTQDLTTCHLQQALNNINNHLQQQQQLHQQQQQQQHHQQHQQQIHSPILKTDYIPNCENSNGGTTVDSTTVDFVMKSELAETQSPYTTAKSAERFLCETNFDSFDIKNNSNSFNNHNNNNNNNINNNNNCTSHLNNNNTNSIDFHSQLAISCQSYDHILIKNDFLTHDSELLAQLAADGTESEFTDLDTGVSAYVHMTNGGCLA